MIASINPLIPSMPEPPDPKIKRHPWAEFYREPMLRSLHAPRVPDNAAPQQRRSFPHASASYAELQVTSNYSFLRGASHPDELVEQAALLGHTAIAITDRNTLAGIVRAHVAASRNGVQLIVGCHLVLHIDHPDHRGELSILAFPTDLASYGRLCRLLTIGKRRAPKGRCDLRIHDLLDHHDGLLVVVIAPTPIDHWFIEIMEGLRRRFDDDRLSLAVMRTYDDGDRLRMQRIAALGEHVRVPLVATNDVHYHTSLRRPLQDVLTCIRHGCTIEQAGLRLFPNAERCLKPPDEMARLFADFPVAIRRTLEIAHRTRGFSLDQLRYQYPDEVVPSGRTPMQHLTDLAWQGAADRYPAGVPEKIRVQIRHELGLIDELRYAPYFLTVHDLVVFARGRGILCQGRGAAANSAVCYCLGVTSVDPDRIDLLFERFISQERNEPPDIDIDFEHERREEVIQYIYAKYGRDRAALTAEVITYRGRSAVRDVGKVMGLSLDLVERLARDIDWWSDHVNRRSRLRAAGLDPDQPVLSRVMALAQEILGFPRHLSQHVGGFVITRGSLCEMVPVENAAMPDRTVIEWDKDDVDAMGMLKVDCLGLGMLTCIRKCFDLLARHYDRSLTLASVPPEDSLVYDMICKADTIGVFQIESRAQMTMLPRLRPRCFYDLVIEVAIVRPGPIQGDMVHPYLRRRNGEEPIDYPNDDVRRVLGKTLGVPLFQEQAMALAIVAAGFTASEADQLRRAMAAWKRKGDKFLMFEDKFIGGMLARGYPRDFAQRCFNQLKGFSEYGFPESHAASFALLVYVSAWMKHHYPAAFAAALLNSLPMGFYAPAQIVRDAQEHGVNVRAVDVNHSQWDCTLEHDGHEGDRQMILGQSGGVLQPALRLGMRLVKGLRREHADRIVDAVRQHGGFTSIDVLQRTAWVPAAAIRRLAAADAFGSFNVSRQSAIWHARALRNDPLPLFEHVPVPSLDEPTLPPVMLPHQVMHDYESVGLSLKSHPIAFIRSRLDRSLVTPNVELQDADHWPQNRRIAVAGLVLVRQRPATASGVIFITLEDETGVANLIVRPSIYERFRAAARHGVALQARGVIERQGTVVHVLVSALHALDDALADLNVQSRDFR